MALKILEELSQTYEPYEARAIGGLLLEHFDQAPHLVNSPQDLNLTMDQEEQLAGMVKRIQAGEPVQYVLGYAHFCEMKIEVNPEVLIPRQETEELVALVLNACTDGPLTILDIGTGSGCIALALKKELPTCQVSACDVSEGAINVARKNATRLEMDIDFFETDVMHTAALPESYDLIVSNPPYVMESDKGAMHANVLEHEPEEALFVSNDDPLVYYECIIELALRHLIDGGQLFFEINESKGPDVVRLLEAAHFKDVALHADLNKKDRFASGRFVRTVM